MTRFSQSKALKYNGFIRSATNAAMFAACWLIGASAYAGILDSADLNEMHKYAFPLLWIICALVLIIAIAVGTIRQTNLLARKRLAAIEAAGDGIGIVDADGNLTYMNVALMNLHGIKKENMNDFIGQKWVKLYTKKGQRQINDIVLPTLRREGAWRGDSPILTANGDIVEAEMSLSLLSDGGFIGTARDITQRKKTEREKEELQKQFIQMQKMEAVGRLTGGIAHDFNNMLTILSGNMEIMEDPSTSEGETRKCMQAARRAIDRGSELTQRLLAFSRKQILTPQIVNINDIIPETVTMMKRSLGEQIDIVTELDSELWTTRVDPGQVENALLNLSINARDAMPEDGGELTIRTSNITPSEDMLARNPFMRRGNYIVVSVSDTGHGIPPEILNRIFDPFFTTKPEGEGTGLGLSMVYGFAKQSGGYLIAENNRGPGATLSLYFPATAQLSIVPSDTLSPAGKAHMPGGRETILTVENEADILDYNKTLLRKLGYEVFAAKSGAEAILMLDTLPRIDMLLTDMIMPGGINGKELADEAKEVFPALKVLFVSGYAKELISGTMEQRPDIGFISKPYTGDQLSQKIRSILDDAPPAA